MPSPQTNPAGFIQVPKFDPQRVQALDQLLSQGLSGATKPAMQPYNFAPIRQNLEQNSFAPIAQREVSRFQTQTVPGIAERFTAFGNNANRGSSAFTGALSQGGVDLGERLAALGANYGLQQQSLSQNLAGLESQYGLNYNAQNLNQANNLLQLGLQPTFDQMPPQPDWKQAVAPSAGAALGAAGELLLRKIASWLTGGIL
jgi:hypothetical protein